MTPEEKMHASRMAGNGDELQGIEFVVRMDGVSCVRCVPFSDLSQERRGQAADRAANALLIADV
jgi:hypothetical protein